MKQPAMNPSDITRRRLLTLGAGVPFAIALGGCDALGNALKPLVGRILSLKLQNISQRSVDLGLGVNVFNPNPIGLPELGLNVGLNLADESIANFGTASPFSLPREGGADLDMNVGINALGLITTLFSLRNASEVPYKLKGQATTPQLGGLTLPLSASGSIKLG